MAAEKNERGIRAKPEDAKNAGMRGKVFARTIATPRERCAKRSSKIMRRDGFTALVSFTLASIRL